jgi:hypothetical protein
MAEPINNVNLAARGMYEKDGKEWHYFDLPCRKRCRGRRLDPLRFTCITCKTPMEYDDVWWLGDALKATIENHEAFFDVFARDDRTFKRKLIRLNPPLITFLAEFHTIVLLKPDQAREALEAVKASAQLFWGARPQIVTLADLQKNLATFFVSLAGSLDAAEAEIEIVTKPEHFNVTQCKYSKIKPKLTEFDPALVPHDVETWLTRKTLKNFRDFFVHRFSLRVLAWTDAGQYRFQEDVDPISNNKTYRVFNEPAHTECKLDSRLANLMVAKLRSMDRLPREFNPNKVYVDYVGPPMLPIILLPRESELEKSPEEIKTFQDQDARDFCEMNYEMVRKLLRSVYAFLIMKWNWNSQH